MSDYIPFEMQSEIIKKLPVRSLLQFRSVSKQWKAFIDSSEFIKTYHIDHPNPKHHLLVEYTIDTVPIYTSIIDDNTFPQQKFSLTTPEPLNKLRYTSILGSVDGLLCVYGLYKDIELETMMVVIWNPSVRKCVGIPIPNVLYLPDGYTRIGFGVCPETNDPKLVKINVVKTPSIYWEVQVFSLSSRIWKTVYTGPSFRSCDLFPEHVFIDGIIYWCSSGSFLISFDFKSEKFGEVCFPESLGSSSYIKAVKVNGSIGLLKCYYEGGMRVCGVWMRKDGVNKLFTKIYSVKVEGNSVLNRVLGFRNNGEVVIQMFGDKSEEYQIEVYKPSLGRTDSVGISGKNAMFHVWSCMGTLLLLDESNSIIH